MGLDVTVGIMRDEEAVPLYQMVERVSEAMVCADFDAEGREEFFGAVSLMLYDRPENHLVLVARLGDRPVGLIDIRSGFHICLFFVDLEVQGQGVGRALFDAMVTQCALPPGMPLEVNSSLFAVPVYEALGFERRSGIQHVNGIRFVEMVRPVVE